MDYEIAQKHLHSELFACTADFPKQQYRRFWENRYYARAQALPQNYREASRARSDAELISKLGIVAQELDETLLWLELLVESSIVSESKMADLHQEADVLLRMTIAAIKTAKKRL